MPDEPLERLLAQIENMLDLVEKNQGKPLSKNKPADVEQQIAALKTRIERYKKFQNFLFSMIDIDAKTNPIAKRNPADLSIYKRAKELKLAVLLKKAELFKKMVALKRAGIQNQGDVGDSKATQKARQKKFRPVGGKKGWKKL